MLDFFSKSLEADGTFSVFDGRRGEAKWWWRCKLWKVLVEKCLLDAVNAKASHVDRIG